MPFLTVKQIGYIIGRIIEIVPRNHLSEDCGEYAFVPTPFAGVPVKWFVLLNVFQMSVYPPKPIFVILAGPNGGARRPENVFRNAKIDSPPLNLQRPEEVIKKGEF